MKIDFGFIGWCYEDNHDKIWGYFNRPSENKYSRNYCLFWGRRGKALQFKSSTDLHKIRKTTESKLDKGYSRIDENRLYSIWPTFQEEMEGKLLIEILTGKIK